MQLDERNQNGFWTITRWAGVASLILSNQGCGQTVWHDITQTGRGQAQLEMDLGACQMMFAQSQGSQPMQPGPTSTVGWNVATQMVLADNFRQSCMLSRGWKETE
jgi:hypothetical protein